MRLRNRSLQRHSRQRRNRHRNIRSSHVIIAGFGRVGTLVADMLKEQDMAYVAVDFDINNVTRGRKSGSQGLFRRRDQRRHSSTACGLKDAKAHRHHHGCATPASSRSCAWCRGHHKELKIIARARDERHAQKLYAAGVTEAVPETIEASLQLAEAMLVETGVRHGPRHRRRPRTPRRLAQIIGPPRPPGGSGENAEPVETDRGVRQCSPFVK